MLSWPVEQSWQLELQAWYKSNSFSFLHVTPGKNSIWGGYSIERNSSFDCAEKKGEKVQSNRFQTFLSLSVGVLMLYVVACVCCAVPGSISVCCFTVCRGHLKWWDCTDCVSNAHTYSHAQTQECPHITVQTQKNEFMDIRTPTKTHAHCLHTCLSCFHCYCFEL